MNDKFVVTSHDPDIALYKQNRRYFAQARDGASFGAPQEIDIFAFDALHSGGLNELVSTAIDNGLPLEPPQPLADLYARRRKISDLLRPDLAPLSVFLDTTTVHNALLALGGRFNAVCLIDLATVAFAAVMYDEIVILKHSNLTDLPDFFKVRALPEADFADKYFKGILNTIVSDLHSVPLDKSEPPIRKIESNWNSFLRLPPGTVRLDLSSYDTYQDSEHWDGIVAGQVEGFDATVLADYGRFTTAFLEAQTLRTFFNHRLAGIARIPYLASSLRNPVHEPLLAAKIGVSEIQDILISRLGPEPIRDLPSRPFRQEGISLPFVLGLILKDKQFKEPRHFWRVVEKYRHLTEALRRDIKDFQYNPVTPLDVQKRYLRWVQEDISKHHLDQTALAAEKTVQATIYDVSAASIAPVPAFSALLALAKLGPKTVLKALAPLLQPAIHVMFRLDQEARGLIDVQAQIAQVWGREIDKGHLEQLRHLTQTNPYDHLILRRI